MLESTQYASIKLLGFVESFYGTPRFGHTKDISYFFSDDAGQRNDYFIGLIFAFCLIMTLAFLWFFILLVLRILGQRVGCASGNAATIPAESMMSKGSYSVHTDETGEFIVMQADQNRVNRTRIVYFLSGLYAVVGSGCLLYGLVSIMRTLTSLVGSAKDVLKNIDSSKLTAVFNSAEQLSTSRADLLTDLTGFCAAAANTISGLNPTEVTDDFMLNLTSVGDISQNDSWNTIQTDFSDLEKLMQSMVDFLKIVDGPGRLWFILSISLASVLAIFLIYMLVCAWKSGKQGYQFIGEDNPTCNTRFLNYFATPIFALLIASAWFMTSTLLAAHTTSADLCYDEILTGETVLRMLNQRGYASTSEAYLSVDEYLHGCLDKNLTPSTIVNDFETTLSDALSAGTSFQELAPNGDTSSLDVVCAGDAAGVMTKSNAVMDDLSSLKTNFESYQTSRSCGTMAPIMQQALYEKQCQSLSRGMLWTFIPALIVSSFGTIMLSLRSATQRPQIYIVAPNPLSRSSDDDNSSYGL